MRGALGGASRLAERCGGRLEMPVGLNYIVAEIHAHSRRLSPFPNGATQLAL